MSVSQGWSRRMKVGAGLAASLMAVGLAVAVAPAQARPDDARGRLATDATGPLTVRDGFVGVPEDSRVDNPTVSARTGPVAAARAHVARYGDAVDADPDEIAPLATQRTVSGRTIVRFAQEVDGLPVIGGEVVVSLDDDHELSSLLTTTSAASGAELPPARVSEGTAIRIARGYVAHLLGRPGGLSATSAGRWLHDPAVLGATGEAGTAWRIEVAGGPDVRRLVLVDDQTGLVRLHVDEIRTLHRAVCDNDNAKRKKLRPCAAPVRTEDSAASAVRDVEEAFEFSGRVAQFYEDIGDLDITELLGIDVGGTKALASTVRWCDAAEACPYFNAFWDGTQMYYGEGFTAAEDVVGHEITHGVISRYSNLFYWGQSGAINESLADIMGEIVDHRFESEGDSPDSWTMGEDLQARLAPSGEPDLQRSFSDPTRHGQPDRMTSPLYTADLHPKRPYADQGGVHTNSGVGNKAAYLISQGGTFNGQTITGIDGADTGLTKTAVLHLNAIQSLSSGSGYAQLADVLEQGCADLVGTWGFTAQDCVEVAKAITATEMRTSPPAAPQPDPAPVTCPLGDEPVVLLDSEADGAADAFAADRGWKRGSTETAGNIALSGADSWGYPTAWHGEKMKPRARSLTVASALRLPADRISYLRFNHWHLFFNVPHQKKPRKQLWLDGGTIEIGRNGRWHDAGPLAWVNGPDRRIADYKELRSPARGRLAFVGDSFGWVGSRLDLSDYAGRTVRPRFTMNLDNLGAFHGWFLDDITIYTCAAAGTVTNSVGPAVSGEPKVGKTLRVRAGAWESEATFAYQWLRAGKAIPKATERTYRLTKADRGKRISVRVTARLDGYLPGIATSPRSPKIRPR